MHRFLGFVGYALVLVQLGCPSAPRQSGPSAPDSASESSSKRPEPAQRERATKRALQRVFPAQVASEGGRGFYTANADELRRQLLGYLDSAEDSEAVRDRDIFGLISPHAGYRYSGPTAAQGYRQLRGRQYRTVVLLALSHRHRADRITLLDHDAYRTPLGDIPIDRELVRALVAAESGLVEVNSRPFSGEHSLEMQLPFLQLVLEDGFRIVPIVLATRNEAHTEQLARLLHAQFGQRRDVLFVASTDFSHHFPYDDASRMDRETIGLITALDRAGFRSRGPRQREMPCGYFPVLTMMHLASLYDANSRRVTLLRYQNSGDTAGGRDRVVGYGSLALSLDRGVRTSKASPEIPPGPATALAARFTEEDRRELMSRAKRSVDAAVRGTPLQPSRPGTGILTEPGAAFVTLRCRQDASGRCVATGEDLRGCIGHIVARVPLYQCVYSVARSAAIEDRRFPTVTAPELEHLVYEISVLTPPELLEDPSTVVVGRDGLIMQRDRHRGLLLPQVPIEWGWDRDTFLQRTCRKARMESTCWSDERTRIERFGAVVWGEDLVAHDHY